MSLAKPLAESYWVDAGRLLAGRHPCSRDAEGARARLRGFLEAGFDLFLDLTEPGERMGGLPFVDYEPELLAQAAALGRPAARLRRPIPDMSVPTLGEMRLILDTLDVELAAGRKIYLHCLGGTGRTGTVVGCYLVRHGATPEHALTRIAELLAETPKMHRRSPETDEQRAMVRGWFESASSPIR